MGGAARQSDSQLWRRNRSGGGGFRGAVAGLSAAEPLAAVPGHAPRLLTRFRRTSRQNPGTGGTGGASGGGAQGLGGQVLIDEGTRGEALCN